jgi:hypothetical protein
MDSRDLPPGQDPPAAAALYISALDHEHQYSAVELWNALSRVQATIDEPAALSELYRQSVQGASTPDEHDVCTSRRDWALRMAWHLALDDGRSGTAASLESLPDSRQTRALRDLRAVRRRPAQIAAAVVGAQMAGVILANETPGVMAITWAGPLNIGLTLVLAQLAFTGWAVLWYVRYARRCVEPVVKRHSASFPHLESRR